MKKSLAPVFGAMFILGGSVTVSAAANPFSDVPADHWAYDAVSQLAADNVINGYGDGTYRGDKNITRYEMAQLIAKAMAKSDVSTKDKALIDKLAAEFADELNNLGVRVAKLEKHADKVKWTGYLRYTYSSERHEYGGQSEKENKDQLLLRLEPKMQVNKRWNVHARLDATTNMKQDTSSNVRLKRAWAQGNYGQFQEKKKKMGLYTNEKGLIFDDEFSGIQMRYASKDKKFRTTLMAGRLDVSDTRLYKVSNDVLNLDRNTVGVDYFNDTASNFIGINLQYGMGKGFSGGIGYYHLSDGMFLMTDQADSNNSKANIWSLNLGYRFDKNFKLWGSYAKNTNAKNSTLYDGEDKSWQIEADYKGAKYANKGSWGAYAAYRRYGATTSLLPTTDGVGWGQKGWEIGAKYVPMKNVLLTAKYFQGKDSLYNNGNSAKKLFGRIEYFF